MKHIGVTAAIGCFTIWGFFPVYWKQLEQVPAVQLALHRIVWSFLLLMLYIFCTRQWKGYKDAISSWRVFGIYCASSLFILTNWLLFVWAINAGYIVEGSLGYFINPIINVIFGVVLLKERLRPWQWVAIFVALVGVLVVAIAYAKFPWIAITLAVTFAIYGYIKKLAPLNSLYGLTLECMILVIPSIIYLVVVECKGTGAFLHIDATSNVLLVCGGVVTIIPLLLFATAAQRISLSLLGVIQYLSPSLQFLSGVFIYHEDFSTFKLIGFICVWAALVISTHRIIWSFLTLLLFILATKQWKDFKQTAFTRWNFVIYTASAVLIFSNWLLFIYAVNSNHVVETSLGYFINPLLNVLLGVVFLKERLRCGQWLSLSIATAGVLVVAIAYGNFPWISLLLALTLGLYGLVKKKAPLNSLFGLTLETAILFIPSLTYLIVMHAEGEGAFLNVDTLQNILIVLAGIVTIIPLLCFSSAAQRIPLSLL
ncbi:hypothetical protein THRCLA_10055, partial [Thraustotheca clavata]